MPTRFLNAVLLVLASAAAAEVPSLAPTAVEFLRTPRSATASDKEALTAEWSAMLRKAGAQVPNRGQMEAALTTLNRRDCETSNECLSQLAGKAGTLYAVYVNLDFDIKKQLVGVARIVRDDGEQVATAKTKAIAQGRRSYMNAAKEILAMLVAELDVKALPPTRPAPKPPEPPPVVMALAPRPTEVSLSTPPPPPVRPAGTKTAGIITLAGGGAALAAGAVVTVLSAVSTRALDGNQNIVPRPGESVTDAASSYRTSVNLQMPGFILLGAGAAVAATGVVLLLVGPGAAPPPVAVTPIPGGAAVAFSSTLP